VTAPVSQGRSDARRAWTVLELLRWTTAHFAERGIESARLDAECLLAHALGTTRIALYLEFDKPLAEDERAGFRELVRRRATERVPVSQLVGRKEFWSLSLRVTSDVLTPRPETETLVTAALEALRRSGPTPEVLDLGTGSGAVALVLAQELPGARITATDLSQEALKVAQQNAEELGMAERIAFVAGAGLEAVPGRRFDLIASNPPYVDPAQRASLPPELAHEPEIALFAERRGFALLEDLAHGAAGWLVPGGTLALEHAPDQAEAVAAACRAGALTEVSHHRDLAGRLRVTTARSRSDAGAAALR
jgi:release factor glutamine methyltransferase